MEKTIDSTSEISEYVVCGATTKCTKASGPSKLLMPESHDVFLKGKPQCNITDNLPLLNILSFGGCKVIGSCVPAVVLPWINKRATTLLLDGEKALIKDAIAVCSVGGIISIEDSGQK